MAVTRLGSERVGAGEAAEGRNHEMTPPQPETGLPERRAGGTGEPQGRMQVTGNAGLIFSQFCGIMNDPEATDVEMRHGGQWQAAGMPIVIALDQQEIGLQRGDPGNKLWHKSTAQRSGGVDQIARDDDPRGLKLVGDGPQSFKVRRRLSLRHGNAAGAEGGGFAEMDIRHHEVTGFRQPDARGG